MTRLRLDGTPSSNGRIGSGPGFGARALADEFGGERERRMAERRRRGICEQCGRPLAVAAISSLEAQLLCRCGFRTVAKRGSRAFKNAALLANGGAR